jgi:hypothetical protein
MAKRPLMDVSELVDSSPSEPELEPEWEEVSTIYARIPRSLFMKLRRKCFELSDGQPKKVTQQDIIIAALRRYLD